jgi:hypothetical protein
MPPPSARMPTSSSSRRSAAPWTVAPMRSWRRKQPSPLPRTFRRTRRSPGSRERLPFPSLRPQRFPTSPLRPRSLRRLRLRRSRTGLCPPLRLRHPQRAPLQSKRLPASNRLRSRPFPLRRPAGIRTPSRSFSRHFSALRWPLPMLLLRLRLPPRLKPRRATRRLRFHLPPLPRLPGIRTLRRNPRRHPVPLQLAPLVLLRPLRQPARPKPLRARRRRRLSRRSRLILA